MDCRYASEITFSDIEKINLSTFLVFDADIMAMM